MKYGIDISNNIIKDKVCNSLKKFGINIINCSDILGESIGENLFKKALLANQTKVDFYLFIDECNDIAEDELLLFFKKNNNIKTLEFFQDFFRNLDDSYFKNLRILNSENLYLSKNIKSELIIIKISKNTSEENLNRLSDAIINTLLLIN